MPRMRYIMIAIIVIILAAVGFFGFTSPGHRVLSSLGPCATPTSC